MESEPAIIAVQPQAGRRSFAARWFILCAVAVVFTAMQMQFSRERFRLAEPPSFDDVTYFNDALARLDLAYDRGWAACVFSFYRTPPHSVVSSAMALVAFLVFGIRDWAPYLLNGLIVLAFLGCVDYFMRPTRLWQRAVAIGMVLCVPMLGITVRDFRPDNAWGLAAAMAVILPLRGRFVGGSWRYQLAAGAWAAAALLCKPSICPLTLLTVFLSWIGASICDRVADPQNFSWRRACVAWLIAALPMLVLAAPFFLLDARGLLAYIAAGSFKIDPKVVGMRGDWKDKALYYINGPAGDYMLQSQIPVIATVLAVGVVDVLWQTIRGGAEQRIRCFRVVGLGIVAFVAYLTPTLVGVNSPFFGAQFQTLAVLGMVLVFRMFLLPGRNALGSVFGSVLLVSCAVASFLLASFPTAWTSPADNVAGLSRARVMHTIESIIVQNAAPTNNVFFTATGAMSGSTMRYLFRQDGLHIPVTDGVEGTLSGDPVRMQRSFDSADFVVAAENGVGEFNPGLPGLPWDQSLQMIRQRPDFHQIASVRSGTGKYFFIFERTRPAGSRD
jgi:hypothetical protein